MPKKVIPIQVDGDVTLRASKAIKDPRNSSLTDLLVAKGLLQARIDRLQASMDGIDSALLSVSVSDLTDEFSEGSVQLELSDPSGSVIIVSPSMKAVRKVVYDAKAFKDNPDSDAFRTTVARIDPDKVEAAIKSGTLPASLNPSAASIVEHEECHVKVVSKASAKGGM